MDAEKKEIEIEKESLPEKPASVGSLPKVCTYKFVPAFMHKPMQPVKKMKRSKDDSHHNQQSYYNFKIYSVAEAPSSERLKQKIHESQSRQAIKINWSALD